MPLFRSRRTTAAEPALWKPLNPEPVPLSGDAADMDDDGQATPFAFKVVFGLPAHPDGPVVTVCTYVVYGEKEGTYCLGLRYVYTAEAHAGWSYAGWAAEPGGGVYLAAADAYGGAWWWASRLAMPAYLDMAAALPEVFGWDGTVF